MERDINDKEKEMIINFGAFEYDATKMANILMWDITEVKVLFTDKNSGFSKMYNQGKDRANYVIDLKLFEMAQGGDIEALNKLERRKLGK